MFQKSLEQRLFKTVVVDMAENENIMRFSLYFQCKKVIFVVHTILCANWVGKKSKRIEMLTCFICENIRSGEILLLSL